MNPLAQDVWDRLGAVRRGDQGILEALVEAVTRDLDPLITPGRDTLSGGDVVPGWSSLMDPTLAPESALAWLGQFVGVRQRLDMTAEQYRDYVASKPGFARGTPADIIATAKRYLTGTKAVTLTERYTSAYKLSVVTFSAETPDPTALAAAVRARIPAGLILAIGTQAGITWDGLTGTWDEQTVTWDEYAEILP